MIRDLSTFNGFTARLTETEARQLEHTKGVTNVWKNEIVDVDTMSTPDVPRPDRRQRRLEAAVRRRRARR